MPRKTFLRADEVANELGVSLAYAYKLIKKLNTELEEQGFIIINGRVNLSTSPKNSTARRYTMSAYKDEKTYTWYAYFRYMDWTGARKQKMKRGFATKREALAYERSFLEQKAADLSMYL